MNRLILSFLLLIAVSAPAQIHEIGVFAGGSNFVGDVGETTYIKPNEFAFGLLYKWNRSPRHSWRASVSMAKITADDSESDMSSRKQRDYDFENTVKEVSLGLEFNFFEFDLHQLERQFTPYVFLGLTYTHYKGLFYEAPNVTKSDSDHGTLSIPFALGVKTNLTKRLIVGFEVAPRYTFADDIDGSSPTNKNLENTRFGNINSNDWYVFSGFTLTYTFGRKPCFCD
ncbi:DUF6089 domain-containing protein [Flavobacterium antarcticum]|uniref:type IX secretion system protein PorG n=1 Tax=Flavobacterium antarcticum TaxID=271155 RepID=UPI0003B4BCB5|nr:DUF6089 family protein [Flavobacterium antarcticum]